MKYNESSDKLAFVEIKNREGRNVYENCDKKDDYSPVDV